MSRLPRGAMRRSLTYLGVLCMAGHVFPRVAEAQVGRTEVEAVRFVGNHAFSSDSLARAIVTRATECRSVVFQPFCWAGSGFAIQRAYLPRRELARDQLRLRVWYQQRGYREATIDTATVEGPDGKVSVTFRIDEGRPVLVDSLEIFGVEDFADADLFERLPLKVGEPLNLIVADEVRDTLVWRMANRGYARADALRSFFIPREDPYSARVTFDVAPGPRSRVGHVSVSGNESLSESTVLRMVQFRAGDLYRAAQVREAQARLFGLEIIRSASVVPDFASGTDSIIPVDVRIQESDSHRVRAGAGWSTSECFDVESRWVSRNFFGGGRRFQVRARVSNLLAEDFQDLFCPRRQSGTGTFAKINWLTSVDFTQPWIFSTRNSFRASLFAERQSLPSIFVRKAVGVSLALTRAIGPRTPLTVSYRPELSRLDAAEILFCTSFLICTPEDISVLQGANWLAPVGLTFTRTTTNNVLNPSRGYSLSLDLEQASPWTGSNFSYVRVVADGSRYERVPGGAVIATRLRGGWIGAGSFGELGQGDVDIIHPQRRFYAGGANSVRGFPQSRLGPRVLTTSVERLLEPEMKGGAGCSPDELIDLSCDASAIEDGGFTPRPTGGTRVVEGSFEVRVPVASTVEVAAFSDFGQVWKTGESVSLSDVEVTPGFGVRYLSPIGPLRLDLAYRFRGGERLSVVTNQLRAYDPDMDDALDRLTVNGQTIPFVQTATLAVLSPRVLFDDTSATSRWQLHLSIGQAF